MSLMKMRKILITAGVYKNYTSELVGQLKNEGESVQLVKKGINIENSKVLGDIRGVSYIYPILYEFGIIEVPESAAIKMNKGKRLKND